MEVRKSKGGPIVKEWDGNVGFHLYERPGGAGKDEIGYLVGHFADRDHVNWIIAGYDGTDNHPHKYEMGAWIISLVTGHAHPRPHAEAPRIDSPRRMTIPTQIQHFASASTGMSFDQFLRSLLENIKPFHYTGTWHAVH